MSTKVQYIAISVALVLCVALASAQIEAPTLATAKIGAAQFSDKMRKYSQLAEALKEDYKARNIKCEEFAQGGPVQDFLQSVSAYPRVKYAYISYPYGDKPEQWADCGCEWGIGRYSNTQCYYGDKAGKTTTFDKNGAVVADGTYDYNGYKEEYMQRIVKMTKDDAAGKWGAPLNWKEKQNDETYSIMTYSVPVFDDNGKVQYAASIDVEVPQAGGIKPYKSEYRTVMFNSSSMATQLNSWESYSPLDVAKTALKDALSGAKNEMVVTNGTQEYAFARSGDFAVYAASDSPPGGSYPASNMQAQIVDALVGAQNIATIIRNLYVKGNLKCEAGGDATTGFLRNVKALQKDSWKDAFRYVYVSYPLEGKTDNWADCGCQLLPGSTDVECYYGATDGKTRTYKGADVSGKALHEFDYNSYNKDYMKTIRGASTNYNGVWGNPYTWTEEQTSKTSNIVTFSMLERTEDSDPKVKLAASVDIDLDALRSLMTSGSQKELFPDTDLVLVKFDGGRSDTRFVASTLDVTGLPELAAKTGNKQVDEMVKHFETAKTDTAHEVYGKIWTATSSSLQGSAWAVIAASPTSPISAETRNSMQSDRVTRRLSGTMQLVQRNADAIKGLHTDAAVKCEAGGDATTRFLTFIQQLQKQFSWIKYAYISYPLEGKPSNWTDCGCQVFKKWVGGSQRDVYNCYYGDKDGKTKTYEGPDVNGTAIKSYAYNGFDEGYIKAIRAMKESDKAGKWGAPYAWTEEDNDQELHLMTFSVPVFDANGVVVAGASVDIDVDFIGDKMLNEAKKTVAQMLVQGANTYVTSNNGIRQLSKANETKSQKLNDLANVLNGKLGDKTRVVVGGPRARVATQVFGGFQLYSGTWDDVIMNHERAALTLGSVSIRARTAFMKDVATIMKSLKEIKDFKCEDGGSAVTNFLTTVMALQKAIPAARYMYQSYPLSNKTDNWADCGCQLLPGSTDVECYYGATDGKTKTYKGADVSGKAVNEFEYNGADKAYIKAIRAMNSDDNYGKWGNPYTWKEEQTGKTSNIMTFSIPLFEGSTLKAGYSVDVDLSTYDTLLADAKAELSAYTFMYLKNESRTYVASSEGLTTLPSSPANTTNAALDAMGKALAAKPSDHEDEFAFDKDGQTYSVQVQDPFVIYGARSVDAFNPGGAASGDGKKANAGAIVGGVIGALVVVGIAVFIFRRQSAKRSAAPDYGQDMV